MRNDRKGIGLGIFLLTIGILWLLSIAKIVTWSTFNALFTLWPLILVAIGIGFIFRNHRIVRALTWLVLLAVVVCYGYFNPAGGPAIKYDLHLGDRTNYSNYTSVTLDKQPQVEKGELTLDYGAMQINIDSSTSGLLDASVNDVIKHSEGTKDDGRTASIKFEMKDDNLINLGAVDKLRNDLHLSKDVVWTLKLDTGAIDGNFDMSGLKVEKLDIETGASKLKLDMGSFNTAIKIDSGASKINITLPDNTGIRVKVDGGLNNTNFKDQGWAKEGNWYYSPEYNSKAFKIEAEIDNGLGDLSVEYR